MPKKPSPLAKSTPSIYTGLDITGKQDLCIVEDVHMLFYIFESKSHIHLIKEAIAKVWPSGLSSFMDIGTQTMLAYHENLFKCTPDKSLTPIQVAQYTFAKIVSLAVDRRKNTVPSGPSGRKSTIGLCEYRPGVNIDQPNMLKTPQANTCLRLFRQAYNAVAPSADKFILEADLRQYIIDNAAELHTKQDPWRIFQYYRPELIAQKLITRK